MKFVLRANNFLLLPRGHGSLAGSTSYALDSASSMEEGSEKQRGAEKEEEGGS